MHLALRARPGDNLTQAIRAAVAEVDREVPVTGLKTQIQQIEETIGNERALMTMLVFFGGFALVLACIGLHGVTAYSVARRTNEIGIRLALGAQRGDVLWLMLRQVVLLTLGGLLLGIPAAMYGSKAVQSLLFGVQPTDASSIGIAAAVLFIVALAAGFVPARAASRLDPLVALRRE
jgi:ABC-type antimicrobial peptide transport system permease subunit